MIILLLFTKIVSIIIKLLLLFTKIVSIIIKLLLLFTKIVRIIIKLFHKRNGKMKAAQYNCPAADMGLEWLSACDSGHDTRGGGAHLQQCRFGGRDCMC